MEYYSKDEVNELITKLKAELIAEIRADKVTMKLQTPADGAGRRKDIHLITSSDEVIINPDTSDSMTLTEKLKSLTDIKIQRDKPTSPGLWARIID